jgi:hypothetical protein
MNRSILNAVCAFAALSLLATAAHATCEDSPRVTGAASDKEKTTMLQQCKTANLNMHKTCDNIPTCNGGAYPQETKAKFVSQIQICINQRRSITSTWFAGTSDEGHDTAVDNKINQLNRCLR